MVKEGFLFAAVPAGAGGLFAWLGWTTLALFAVLLAAFVLYFFRDPAREIPSGPGVIVSPADGRVVDIREVEWEGQPKKKVSIFLSLFDVHVNRAPIAGEIQRIEHRPGKFLAAMKAEASQQNEQNIVTVAGEHTSVVFAQIAGVLARRIIFWKHLGDRLALGERVGMIRFGSRVDVFLEPSCQLAVALGEHVKGGSTVLARLP